MGSETPSRAHDATVIVALTGRGAELAIRLKNLLPGSSCFVPNRHVRDGCEGFERVAGLIPVVWTRCRNLLCIMASGIVVRLIAPLLTRKSTDPAVVVLDEKGRFAVSLVSGHLGGANRLACEVAALIGAEPVITTASDVQGKPAIDLIVRDAGLEIENPALLSRISRAVIEEEPMWLFDPDGRIDAFFDELPNVEIYPACRVRMDNGSFERSSGADGRMESRGDGGAGMNTAPCLPPGPESAGGLCPDWPGQTPEERLRVRGALGIWVSEKLSPPGVNCLELRPRNLVVGIGCNRRTESNEIVELLRKIFRSERLSPLSIRNFASIDLKADERGILDAAGIFDRPVSFYSRADLGGMKVPNPSATVEKHIGVQSVCEAAALLSAQSRTLLLVKRKTANVTLAVARVACP